MIAYIYGDEVPPDFATLAACGFTTVCLDTMAPWYDESMPIEGRAFGLTVVAFAMKYVLGRSAVRREDRIHPRRAS
jgi:hypothetical protein